MADTFQGMTENRTAGMTRSRLAQYYRDLGYSPEMAAAKAAVDISNGNAPAGYGGDSPRESTAVRTANDALAQRREMNDRDLGPENQAQMQEFYRKNPRLLGVDQPPTKLAELPGYDPTRTEGGMPNRYDSVYREVQTGSGEPIVRFSGPTTEDEVIARRGEQPNIYQRMYGGVKGLLSPLPSAPSQGSGQPPTYSTPNYPVPSESGSSATNRLIDRAFSAVTGNSPAAAAPAAAPTQIGGNYNDVFNVPYNPQGGEYNDVFNAPYNPPTKTAAPARQPAQMPLPPRRPDSMGKVTDDNQSLLSRIFSAPKDPYAGQSAAQLMKTANENPDNAAAFFRADKALQKEQPDMFKPQAEKRGGSVSGGKDAALHKALEIIHHLLTRGH